MDYNVYETSPFKPACHEDIVKLRDAMREKDKNIAACVDEVGKKNEVNLFDTHFTGVVTNFNSFDVLK